MKKLFLILGFLIVVVLIFKNIGIYKGRIGTFFYTYPDIATGCFDICDREPELIKCTKDNIGIKKCKNFCFGKLSNSCKNR